MEATVPVKTATKDGLIKRVEGKCDRAYCIKLANGYYMSIPKGTLLKWLNDPTTPEDMTFIISDYYERGFGSTLCINPQETKR